ncbi:hypothetical protein DXG01_006171, partial [Tephrocybe rancida]
MPPCIMSTRKPAVAKPKKSATPTQATRRQAPVSAGKENEPTNTQRTTRERRFTSHKVLAKPAQRALLVASRAFTPMKCTSKVPPAPSQQLTPRAPDVKTTYEPEDESMNDASNNGSDDLIDLIGSSDFEDDDMDGSDFDENDGLEANYDYDDQYGELTDHNNNNEREPISDKHRIYAGHVDNAAFPCGVPTPHLRPLPGKPVPARVVLDLRTPTPSSTNKRPRSESLDNATAAPPTIKATKISDNTGRPKASDYDDTGKETILTAANIFRCFISTVNGFPDSGTEIQFVQQAWQRANENTGLDPAIDLTPDIGKIIKQRGSQTRGEAKSKTASLVETMYGFNSGQGRKIVAANRDLAERLKLQKGFLYKELTEDIRKGIYKHAIIQMAINKMWFKNKRDEGVVYTDMFYPMPIPAIALILTAIECNIDEWVSGTKTDIAFYADDYRTTYMKHIESLETF